MKKIIMKVYAIPLLFIISANICSAQVLKNFGNKVKEEVEWRAQRKAGQKIDQGLDSILAAPKKIIKKKESYKSNTDTQASEESTTAKKD